MDARDREMIAWWQKNDRVTLSIAKTDPERLAWAKEHKDLFWQTADNPNWKFADPKFSDWTTYRIDPAYQIPAEPVSPWEEVDIKPSGMGEDHHEFWIRSRSYALYEAIGLPGFGGVLWRDDATGLESWNLVPMGVYQEDVDGFALCTDPDRWLRPCKPVRVRFWRGA